MSLRPYIVLAAAALTACGASARPAQTTVTAAEVPSSLPPPAPPEAREAEPEAKPEAPPGDLTCRTKTDAGETSALYVEWKGNEGMGTLVRVAPSGMTYRKRVTTERDERVVIADDINQVDLVAHAAMLAKKDGKQYMRLADGEWRLCE